MPIKYCDLDWPILHELLVEKNYDLDFISKNYVALLKYEPCYGVVFAASEDKNIFAVVETCFIRQNENGETIYCGTELPLEGQILYLSKLEGENKGLYSYPVPTSCHVASVHMEKDKIELVMEHAESVQGTFEQFYHALTPMLDKDDYDPKNKVFRMVAADYGQVFSEIPYANNGPDFSVTSPLVRKTPEQKKAELIQKGTELYQEYCREHDIAHFYQVYEYLQQIFHRPLMGCSPDEISAAEVRLGISLPDCVKEFHRYLGHEENLMTAPYQFYTLDKLKIFDEQLCLGKMNRQLVGVETDSKRADHYLRPIYRDEDEWYQSCYLDRYAQHEFWLFYFITHKMPYMKPFVARNRIPLKAARQYLNRTNTLMDDEKRSQQMADDLLCPDFETYLRLPGIAVFYYSKQLDLCANYAPQIRQLTLFGNSPEVIKAVYQRFQIEPKFIYYDGEKVKRPGKENE